MSMGFGVFLLAFVFFASVALGTATAWGLYALTRRRWVWLLTPVFAIFWLLLGAGPFLLVAWAPVARPAPVVAPAPYPASQTRQTENEDRLTEALEEAQ